MTQTSPARQVAPAPAVGQQPAGHARLAPASEVGVVTWNVQHASVSRSADQVAWLAQEPTADLLVLTEVGHGPGGTALCDALGAAGYQVVDPSPGGGDYRTVLASRHSGLTCLGSLTQVFPHRTPVAQLTIGTVPVVLSGLYVPSRGRPARRNVDKRAVQEAVSRALPALVAQHRGPVVVAGDLNVVDRGHRPHHKVFGPWEYGFYDSFAAAGLTDAYLAHHTPGTDHDHSWFGRAGTGYRFDHAFLTSAHRRHLTACAYLHTPRLTGLSDHSALSLLLRLPSPPAGAPAHPAADHPPTEGNRT
ncbi:endonuclease/exonuclease/phosphatase family protein [Streptomyces sp. CA-111067]|uniref:endonuclease/exonuclease/phosphatase family protein n=1 Tax=Streptomyces sp. CA-111067 TaxID=3240046 RepID=UPI003D99C609